MSTRRPHFTRWLISHALAALLLLSGMPRLECCCVGDASEGSGSCCGSGSVERRSPLPGGCGCDPAGDCDCEHDLGGPPVLPAENAGIEWDFQVTGPATLSPAPALPPAARPTRVATRERTRASPPPLFVVNCAFRC